MTARMETTRQARLPAPAAGVRLFLLDDEGLLFSAAVQTIHALNTTAAFIWCCLEERQTLGEAAARLADSFGFSPADAGRHVAIMLDTWRGLGLLAGGASPQPMPVRRPPEETFPDAATMPPYPQAHYIGERCYALLAARVRVRFTALAQEAWFHPVLAHLAADTSRGGATIDIVLGDDCHLVYRDEMPVCVCRGLDRLAPVIKGLVWQAGVNSHRYFLDIHAGVVGDGRSCILLPGAAGSSKSSLTAALCRSGFRYFSDEIALLEPGDLRVRPTPLGICAKSTGWDILAPYYPELSTLPVHVRGDGKLVRYLPPPVAAHADRDRSYPVSRIIFPRYAAGQQTALTPLTRTAALQRLLDQCLVLPVDLQERNVGDLVRWIKRVECFELRQSSLAEAVRLICDLPAAQASETDRGG
jgi:hypothetical protein